MKTNDLSSLSSLLSTDEKSQLAKEATEKKAKRKIGEGQDVRVSLDKKMRRGKAVTVIEGLRLSTEMRDKLARDMKQRFSAGGTAGKDTIELQGDHVTRPTENFKQNGFTVRTK